MIEHIVAIHPKTGDIEPADLVLDHFGKNKHAVSFKETNGPYFIADEIEYYHNRSIFLERRT